MKNKIVPYIIPQIEQVLVKIGEGEEYHRENPNLLDVFVWNVYKGQRAGLFETDFRSLGQNRDFIMLQEATVDHRMPKLWREDFSAYEWHMAQSFHYKKDLTSTGVAIGSRLKPDTVEFIRSKTRELFWLTPKLTLFNVYNHQGTQILFVCTHVLNFVTLGAFTQSLYEIAEKVGAFTGPVVLAGDFNTWNTKRYLAMKSIFRDLRLDHVELADDSRYLKLDHVFVRGFDIVNAKVLPAVTSSDHFPLDIKLKISK